MVRLFLKQRKQAIKFLGNHIEYNALIHMVGGVGLGILIASPLADPHPVRWGLILLGLSLLGHLYIFTVKK